MVPSDDCFLFFLLSLFLMFFSFFNFVVFVVMPHTRDTRPASRVISSTVTLCIHSSLLQTWRAGFGVGVVVVGLPLCMPVPSLRSFGAKGRMYTAVSMRLSGFLKTAGKAAVSICAQ